ncbi:fibroblast growth factor receptor substrate 2 isoform X2 [Coccinella septempunctata]|nr:fibroblast growth factor receptor substrate 2 isoform X2 [Coccinella septempunctata]
MGCVSSKQDINDLHPNLFQVSNVNDDRELVSPGQLEITETELILHQKGKTPLVWPLRTLRKYGLDQEIFTFECGRRCPTGEGIYAFQCKRAEQLFNIVHQNVSRNVGDDSNTNGDFLSGIGPPLTRRMPSQIQPEGYLTPLSAPNVHTLRTYPAVRPGSVTISGPISPPAVSPPPNVEISLEHNNNKRGSLISNSSFTYTNTSALENHETQPNYANLGMDPALSNTEPYVNMNESVCHVYMNIDTKEVLPIPTKENPDPQLKLESREDENKHCYANIDAKDMEQLRTFRSSLNHVPNTLPQPSNIYLNTRKVNYAKLDFDTKDETIVPQIPPESPTRTKDSYAVIDFYRTNALSQSVNPTMDVEEGVRKTRHNSSISDVITRTSSSLSD